jgi:hypothetical protein
VLVVIAAMSTVAGAACNRSNSEQPPDSPGKNATLVNPRITMVRGCLTGSGDQFVLTNLEQGAPGPTGADRSSAAEPVATTDSYRLVGMNDQLRGFVGQRVEVTGDSQPEQIVDLVSATPAHAPATGGTVGTSGKDAKVSTASRARVAIHEMRVSSVSPLGDKCPGN